MNATKKCPVCPLDDVPPSALQCPNCKTDLTLLRRIEGLADSFVRDAEKLRATDPKGALRALHTALSLEPSNESYQQLVAELEQAAAREKPQPALVAPATPTTPVAVSSPDALKRRSSPIWALATGAVAVLAFGAGHLLPQAPTVSSSPAAPAIAATPTPPQASGASDHALDALAKYQSDHHHTDDEYVALQARVNAAQTTKKARLSPEAPNKLQALLGSGGNARIVRSRDEVYVVFTRPLFALGSSDLDRPERKQLTQALSALASLKVDVEIEGHCDAQVSPRNWDLAMDRARAVAALAQAVAPALTNTVRAVPKTPIPGTALSDAVNRGVALKIVVIEP